MRIIDLDFYSDKGGTIFLGYAQEHFSTVLNFHMPAELGKTDCLYVINFVKDGDSSAEPISGLAFRTGFNTNIVSFYLPNTVTGNTNVASSGQFQLFAYGGYTEENGNTTYSLLGKSTIFNYIIDKPLSTGSIAAGLTFEGNSNTSTEVTRLLQAISDLGNIQSAVSALNNAMTVLEGLSENTGLYELTANKISATASNLLNNTVTVTNDTNKYLNAISVINALRSLKSSINTNKEKIGYDSVSLLPIDGVTPTSAYQAINLLKNYIYSIDSIVTNLETNKADINEVRKYKAVSNFESCSRSDTHYTVEYEYNSNDGDRIVPHDGIYSVLVNIEPNVKKSQIICGANGNIYIRTSTWNGSSWNAYGVAEQIITSSSFNPLRDKIGDTTDIEGRIAQFILNLKSTVDGLGISKIDKDKAIKFATETNLDNCTENGTIYRCVITSNGQILASGDYTVIPSFTSNSTNAAQYIFSTTNGKIYFRYKDGNAYSSLKTLATNDELTSLSNTLNDLINGIINNKVTQMTGNESSEDRNNKYPTVGAVEDYIDAGKDYIATYTLSYNNVWTQIIGGWKLELNTALIPDYNFTNKTKIDIEPTIELYSLLEKSFCTGLYVETNDEEETTSYNFIALNNQPNIATEITIQLKLSEVNYLENIEE